MSTTDVLSSGSELKQEVTEANVYHSLGHNFNIHLLIKWVELGAGHNGPQSLQPQITAMKNLITTFKNDAKNYENK